MVLLIQGLVGGGILIGACVGAVGVVALVVGVKDVP